MMGYKMKSAVYVNERERKTNIDRTSVVGDQAEMMSTVGLVV